MGSFKVFRMAHLANYSTFLKCLESHMDDDRIDITFNVPKAYPVACVPIAGTIDSLKKTGRNIHIHYSPDSFLASTHFDMPYKVEDHLDSLAFPFSKVWKFNDFSEVTKLVNAFLDEISSVVECSAGLVEGLEWSLNETMDNVLQHSLCSEGYVMGVVHKSTNYVLFSIFDNGQGIYNSLRNSEYHPRSAIDAISIAIQEGKTRDHNVGQGNGLWGLNNIVLKNHGKLAISSHGCSLMIHNDGTSTKYEDLPLLDKHNATTSVDISFNYSNTISVADALKGHIPSDIRFEDKVDDSNCFKFVLAEESAGFGTRIAGERVRNKVINYLQRIDGPRKMEIDFSGVSLISSSFADEFIGKLLTRFGFFRFTKVISLTGVSPTVEAILNRSVSQRMAILFSTEQDTDISSTSIL